MTMIVHPVSCFCAVTRDGTLIPWLCDTDRERLVAKLKEKRLTWRARAVRIALEEPEQAPESQDIAPAPLAREVLEKLDRYWSEDAPSGPDSSQALCFTEETRSIWRDVRAAILAERDQRP